MRQLLCSYHCQDSKSFVIWNNFRTIQANLRSVSGISAFREISGPRCVWFCALPFEREEAMKQFVVEEQGCGAMPVTVENL